MNGHTTPAKWNIRTIWLKRRIRALICRKYFTHVFFFFLNINVAQLGETMYSCKWKCGAPKFNPIEPPLEHLWTQEHFLFTHMRYSILSWYANTSNFHGISPYWYSAVALFKIECYCWSRTKLGNRAEFSLGKSRHFSSGTRPPRSEGSQTRSIF